MINLLRTIGKGIPVIVILLIVIELLWSNTLVVSGREVSATDLAIAAVRQENERLAEQIASASAIPAVAAQAKDMGFVTPKPSQFVMMSGDTLPVAINRPQ